MRFPRIGITGSRRWTNVDQIHDVLGRALGYYGGFEYVVHGGAIGADSIADLWARRVPIPVIVHEPDYAKFGSEVAPLMRNRLIVNECDVLLAFRSFGLSNGTDFTIKFAEQKGKTRYIFREKRVRRAIDITPKKGL